MKTYKKLVTIIALLILWLGIGRNNLQAQIWDWGRQAKSQDFYYDSHSYSATDPLGNVVVVGQLRSSTTFGMTSISGLNGFMVKYAPDGSLLWVKSLLNNNCSEEIIPSAIQIDGDGNIYALSNCGTDEHFLLVKYAPDGNEISSVSPICGISVKANDIEIGPNGGIFIAGNFGPAASLTLEIGGVEIQTQPGAAINRPFLCKLSSNFEGEWISTEPTPSIPSTFNAAYGERVAVDPQGNVYLMGVTTRQMIFSTDISTGFSSAHNGQIYALKVDELGVPQWISASDRFSSSRPSARDLQFDPQNETLVLYGNYSTSFNWDTLQFPSTIGAFHHDFILGLNPQGAFKFFNFVDIQSSVTRGFGGMVIDTTSGHIYTTGVGQTAILEGMEANLDCPSVVSYVAAFDSLGSGQWIEGIDCSENINENVWTSDIVYDYQGSFYVSGALNEWVVFGLDTLETLDPSAPFCAKLLQKEAVISGKVFRDFNGNGLIDNEDEGIPNQILQSDPLNLTMISGTNGDYQFEVNLNTHKVRSVSLPQHHQLVSPNNGIHTVLTHSPGQIILDKNFAFQPLPNIQDLEIELTPMNPVSPGFVTRYQLLCSNTGSTPQDALVQFNFPDIFEFYDSGLPANLDSLNNSISWDVGTLEAFQDTTLEVSFSVFTTAILGNSITSNVQLFPIAGDIEPEDNTINLTQIITGSFDPNDKQALTGNTITPKEIQEEKLIDYLIRFQNTGTEKAYTVIVKDIISSNLNMETFQMIDASHPYNFVGEDSLFTWRFDNILLPDSTTNEPESHGFIRFRIAGNFDLVLGDTIYNQANIFFDFNSPVLTNTHVLTVDVIDSDFEAEVLTSQMRVFPNPGTGDVNLSIESPISGNWNLYLFDITGSSLLGETVELNAGWNLLHRDWKNIPSGIYFIVLEDRNTFLTSRWVKN